MLVFTLRRATVTADQPSRYLSWTKADLRAMLMRDPSLRLALDSAIACDLTRKLRAQGRGGRG